jgi:hypothetical protein
VSTVVRIAVVQSLDGNLTCCGPNDFKGGDYNDQMNAAIGWSIEAGYLPAAHYWVTVELPPIPTIPELRAQAERGEFPKSFIEEMDSQ